MLIKKSELLPNGFSENDRYKFALDYLTTAFLAVDKKCHVYDVGAGDGRMQMPILSMGCEWSGFDLIPKTEYIKYWNIDDTFDGSNNADILIMLDVLEHCSNPARALKHVAQVIRKGGRLLLTVPNPRWSKSRLHALLNGYPTCFTQADLNDNGHVFTPWPHIVKNMLQEAGFVLENYITIDGKTSLPTISRFIRAPHTLLSRLFCMYVERKDPSACGFSYAMVARKM